MKEVKLNGFIYNDTSSRLKCICLTDPNQKMIMNKDILPHEAGYACDN